MNNSNYSMRGRFMIAVSLCMAMGIAAIWLFATRLYANNVEQDFDDELAVHIQELAGLTEEGADGQPLLQRPLSDPRYLQPLSGFYWQITTQGRQTLRSPSLTRGAFDDTIAQTAAVRHAIEPGPTGPAITYGFSRATRSGLSQRFVIATDRRHFDRIVNIFNDGLTTWLMVLAGGLIVTGLAIIAFGLRPLDRLAKATANLRAGRTARLEGAYPSEIAPLVDELNAYIVQSAENIARARAQAGNLAHSLRTPLAVITDEAEQLAANPAMQETSRILLEQSRIMAAKIDFELARARMASGRGTSASSAALPGHVDTIVSAICRLHRDKQFEVIDRLPSPRKISIDSMDFVELLSSVLDNAGKWAACRIEIGLDELPSATRISVTDDGPGMTADQIERAFQTGTRFDPEMDGSGLGLAIAKDIADAAQATLTLASATGTLRGLAVTLTIPHGVRE